jgi:phosphate-selective porin OprO and OprP
MQCFLSMVRIRVPVCFLMPLFLILLLSGKLYSQKQPEEIPDGTDGEEFPIPDIDSLTGKPKHPVWNEFENPYSTFIIGFGLIEDYVTQSQDNVFKQQMDSAGLTLTPQFKLRDFRMLASGLLKTKRMIAWKFAYSYDGDQNVWLFRESGITIGVPEINGFIFVGRTKEGFSMVKVMNGHSPWTAERQMALDAIPILADGIKYFGYLPKSRIFWNLGAYSDLTSKGQAFSTYSWQTDARVGWMPFYNPEKNNLLHLAANIRFGQPVNGQITLKSRPESNPTPQILNTGPFVADYSTNLGGEIYYNNGGLMLGSEVIFDHFYSKKSGDHKFYGGDFVASYFFTHTRRPYHTKGSIFGFVPVAKSVFKGGWGEWEGVLHLSKLDLNDGSVQGGSCWRLTPMVNWYMSKIVRMEFIYGYSVLDKYNVKGKVQFYQWRIQFTIM